jgi:hypothetical protein
MNINLQPPPPLLPRRRNNRKINNTVRQPPPLPPRKLRRNLINSTQSIQSNLSSNSNFSNLTLSINKNNQQNQLPVYINNRPNPPAYINNRYNHPPAYINNRSNHPPAYINNRSNQPNQLPLFMYLIPVFIPQSIYVKPEEYVRVPVIKNNKYLKKPIFSLLNLNIKNNGKIIRNYSTNNHKKTQLNKLKDKFRTFLLDYVLVKNTHPTRKTIFNKFYNNRMYNEIYSYEKYNKNYIDLYKKNKYKIILTQNKKIAYNDTYHVEYWISQVFHLFKKNDFAGAYNIIQNKDNIIENPLLRFNAFLWRMFNNQYPECFKYIDGQLHDLMWSFLTNFFSLYIYSLLRYYYISKDNVDYSDFYDYCYSKLSFLYKLFHIELVDFMPKIQSTKQYEEESLKKQNINILLEPIIYIFQNPVIHQFYAKLLTYDKKNPNNSYYKDHFVCLVVLLAFLKNPEELLNIEITHQGESTINREKRQLFHLSETNKEKRIQNYVSSYYREHFTNFEENNRNSNNQFSKISRKMEQNVYYLNEISANVMKFFDYIFFPLLKDFFSGKIHSPKKTTPNSRSRVSAKIHDYLQFGLFIMTRKDLIHYFYPDYVIPRPDILEFNIFARFYKYLSYLVFKNIDDQSMDTIYEYFNPHVDPSIAPPNYTP